MRFFHKIFHEEHQMNWVQLNKFSNYDFVDDKKFKASKYYSMENCLDIHWKKKNQ